MFLKLLAASVLSLSMLATSAADTPSAQTKAEPKKTLVQRIAEAKKSGYTLVNREGTVLFCRTRLKTGSRLVRETECLTEDEIDMLGDASRRGLADITREQPPPQGK